MPSFRTPPRKTYAILGIAFPCLDLLDIFLFLKFKISYVSCLLKEHTIFLSTIVLLKSYLFNSFQEFCLSCYKKITRFWFYPFT
jgi:hypothetical protein